MKSTNKNILALNDLAKKFRTNKIPEASIELAETLQSAATDPDFSKEIDTTKLGLIIREIYTCQSKNDWLGLADYLDHDLPKVLLNTEDRLLAPQT